MVYSCEYKRDISTSLCDLPLAFHTKVVVRVSPNAKLLSQAQVEASHAGGEHLDRQCCESETKEDVHHCGRQIALVLWYDIAKACVNFTRILLEAFPLSHQQSSRR